MEVSVNVLVLLFVDLLGFDDEVHHVVHESPGEVVGQGEGKELTEFERGVEFKELSLGLW